LRSLTFTSTAGRPIEEPNIKKGKLDRPHTSAENSISATNSVQAICSCGLDARRGGDFNRITGWLYKQLGTDSHGT